jgi:YVTN family beta-propeller protein
MTHRRLVLFAVATVLSVALVGCDLLGSDDDAPATVTSGVYVANQGQFGPGTGSVSVYNPQSDSVSPRAITGLNSIVQSIALRNDRLYLTANTGGRLDVFAPSSLNPVGQVSQEMPSPRYVAFPNDRTAYVTNLFDDISVVDLPSNTVTDTIVTGGSPEGITVAGNRVYTALGAFSASSEVAVIDPATDTVTTTIDLGCTARFVLADAQNDVFALCNDSQTGQAVVLNDTQEQARLPLPDSVRTAGPGQDAHYAPDAELLHVVVNKNRLVRINTATNEIVETIGPVSGAPVGAVAYDANRQELYLGRVPSFTEAGSVTIHDRDGTRTGAFAAGVVPTYITVDRARQ